MSIEEVIDRAVQLNQEIEIEYCTRNGRVFITDSDDVAVHIKKHFLFVQHIPDLKDYLKLTLDSFFRTARTLDIEVEKCRMQEYER